MPRPEAKRPIQEESRDFGSADGLSSIFPCRHFVCKVPSWVSRRSKSRLFAVLGGAAIPLVTSAGVAKRKKRCRGGRMGRDRKRVESSKARVGHDEFALCCKTLFAPASASLALSMQVQAVALGESELRYVFPDSATFHG